MRTEQVTPGKANLQMNPITITYKLARRIVIAAVGGTVLLIGVIMIVTPGPAFIFIPVGLAILGLEFAWARAWLKRIRQHISNNNANGRAARAEGHRRRHDGD
jgi:tellurite resistance protein TerC